MNLENLKNLGNLNNLENLKNLGNLNNLENLKNWGNFNNLENLNNSETNKSDWFSRFNFLRNNF